MGKLFLNSSPVRFESIAVHGIGERKSRKWRSLQDRGWIISEREKNA